MMTAEEVALKTGGTLMNETDFFAAIESAAASYDRDEQIKKQEEVVNVKPLKGTYVAEVRDFVRQQGEAFGKPKDQYALNVQIIADERNSDEKGVNLYVSEYYSVLDSVDAAGSVYATANDNQEKLCYALFNMGFNTEQTKNILANPESLKGKQIFIRVWGAKKKEGDKFVQKVNSKGYPVHKMSVLAMPADEDSVM